MKLLAPGWRSILDARRIVLVLLALWAAGLVVAAFQLDGWRRELSRTLMQLSADAHFRDRAARHRQAVDPEWYRRKALALLGATDTLNRDAAWTLFIPGSWQVFDDLEERVARRVEREFGDIVVETIRRELVARASQLTGVPLDPVTAHLRAGGGCKPPAAPIGQRRLTAAAEDLPEYQAVRRYVDALAELDQAVRALEQLQRSPHGDAATLRRLVAYTLGTELPGSLARAVPLFHRPDEADPPPRMLAAALQGAARCTLVKGMGNLFARLLSTNDLLALEQSYLERSAGLFDPGVQPAAFDRTLERYKAVATLLEDQHALLARGGNDWMREGTRHFGPGYQAMLDRVGRMGLLGPEVLQQLQHQSGAAFAEFRRVFESTFGGRGDPGIVWLEGERRFGLSPLRSALRDGLGALLKEPYMAEEAAGGKAREAGELAPALQAAQGLADARRSFLEQKLPLFPPPARKPVARVIDARVGDLVYQRVFRAVRKAAPDPAASPDPMVYQAQREQVLQAQGLLAEIGANALGARLLSTHQAEVARRLHVLHEELRRLPLLAPRAADFRWWQGDPAPLWQLLAASDAAAVQRRLAEHAGQLAGVARKAQPLVPLADEANAQRWRALLAELARWQQRRPDSSGVALEKYLLALGADLRRENCTERLAAQAAPPAAPDELGQGLARMHAALKSRCDELNATAPTLPAAAPAPLASGAVPASGAGVISPDI